MIEIKGKIVLLFSKQYFVIAFVLNGGCSITPFCHCEGKFKEVVPPAISFFYMFEGKSVELF